MKRKRLFSAVLATAMLVTALSGCSGAAIFQNGQKPKPVRMSSVNLMADVKPQSQPETSLADDFTGAYTDFSLELLNRAAADKTDVLVSPLSVSMALGLASVGAAGDTKAAFDALFGTDKAPESFKALMSSLTGNASSEVVLTLANGIWVDDSFQANPDFLQSNADFFDAGLFQADLQDSRTVKDINKWITANTGDKIQDLVKSPDPYAKLLLVNALYFKAPWEKTFDKATNGVFHAPGGDVTVPMMGHTKSYAYTRGEDFQAILLPYKNSPLAFLAVLPDEGIDIRDFSLTAEDYMSILAGKDNTTACYIRMPVFTAKSEMSLNEILSNMGLSAAFDPRNADFSKMGSSVDNLFIGNVSHAAWMAVTETGTEAAAATSVEMVAAGIQLDPPPEIILNRPFLYGIVDRESSLPVFLGILSNP